MRNRQKEIINQLTDRQLILNLYFSQFIIFISAIFLSYLFLNGPRDLIPLFKWNDEKIITIGGSLGVIVFFIDVLLMKVLPPSYYDDGGINERVFANRSIFFIILFSGVVAVSEELLFRGVIQTAFGLIVASIIFALVHYRYLFHWFLFLNVFLLSFLFDYVYQETNNLLITMFMHFLINCLLGIYLSFRKRRQKQNADQSRSS